MEDGILSPQTPHFANPNKNINFFEILKMELDRKSNSIEKTKTNNKE